MSKTFTAAKMKQIIEDHSKWLRGVSGGRRAKLESADLRGAKLESADLRGAKLESADLYGANLRVADLESANLYGANLRGANLYGANLRGANLYGANLRVADLESANLYGANLESANLYGANLRGAKLESADLRGAKLESADLRGANLRGAQMSPFQIPEGTFIGWKKVLSQDGYDQRVLKLSIEGERTGTPIGRKCRTSKAVVLAAFDTNGNPVTETVFRSSHSYAFVYRVGEAIEEPSYNSDIRLECTSGIHFFLTRNEAENLVLP